SSSSSSDLPVMLSVNDVAIATVSGTDLILHRGGSVTVTAIQEGNENYVAADPVSITIRVIETFPDLIHLQISKALSPNGDGINDYLLIERIEPYPDNKLVIFDQGGNILSEIEGYNNQEKKFTGERLTDGTYFYHLYVVVEGKRSRM